jgi:hypothetical protein
VIVPPVVWGANLVQPLLSRLVTKMPIVTELTKALGIRVPVVQGGMASDTSFLESFSWITKR